MPQKLAFGVLLLVVACGRSHPEEPSRATGPNQDGGRPTPPPIPTPVREDERFCTLVGESTNRKDDSNALQMQTAHCSSGDYTVTCMVDEECACTHDGEVIYSDFDYGGPWSDVWYFFCGFVPRGVPLDDYNDHF